MLFVQVVTTKRRPLSQTSSNYNNSPNSPFKDDDENSREKDNKNAKKIFGNGVVGKNQLSNTAINLCKGDQGQLKTNHNFAISNLENWKDQTAVDTQYYPQYVNSRLEPDIILITAQKLRNDTDCDAATEQMLTSRDSSITPPNLALTKHKDDQYNDYINTGSSGTFKSFEISVHVLSCTICRSLKCSKYIHLFHSFSDVREFNRCKL